MRINGPLTPDSILVQRDGDRDHAKRALLTATGLQRFVQGEVDPSRRPFERSGGNGRRIDPISRLVVRGLTERCSFDRCRQR